MNTLVEVPSRVATKLQARRHMTVSYGAKQTEVPTEEFSEGTFENLRQVVSDGLGVIPENVVVRSDEETHAMADQIPAETQSVEFVARAGKHG